MNLSVVVANHWRSNVEILRAYQQMTRALQNHVNVKQTSNKRTLSQFTFQNHRLIIAREVNKATARVFRVSLVQASGECDKQNESHAFPHCLAVLHKNINTPWMTSKDITESILPIEDAGQ